MKATITFLLLAISSTLTGYAQSKSMTWKDFDLKGRVKSVEEISYLGVYKFGDLTKGRKINEGEDKFNKNGYVVDRYYYSYDEDGEKEGFKQSFSYDKNDFLIGGTEEDDGETIEFKLINNASGKVETLDALTKKGKLMLRQKTKYNAAGKETEMAEYDANGDLVKKTIYTYSASGDRKEEKTVDKNGKTVEVNISVFDSRGNVIEANMIEYKGSKKEEYLRKYTYNQANKKIEERNSISGLDKKETFAYDDKGNLIRNVDEYGSTQTITYTYDSQGNWIKKVVEENSAFLGEKTEITERTIRYY